MPIWDTTGDAAGPPQLLRSSDHQVDSGDESLSADNPTIGATQFDLVPEAGGRVWPELMIRRHPATFRRHISKLCRVIAGPVSIALEV